jgi:hypothetical protein
LHVHADQGARDLLWSGALLQMHCQGPKSTGSITSMADAHAGPADADLHNQAHAAAACAKHPPTLSAPAAQHHSPDDMQLLTCSCPPCPSHLARWWAAWPTALQRPSSAWTGRPIPCSPTTAPTRCTVRRARVHPCVARPLRVAGCGVHARTALHACLPAWGCGRCLGRCSVEGLGATQDQDSGSGATIVILAGPPQPCTAQPSHPLRLRLTRTRITCPVPGAPCWQVAAWVCTSARGRRTARTGLTTTLSRSRTTALTGRRCVTTPNPSSLPPDQPPHSMRTCSAALDVRRDPCCAAARTCSTAGLPAIKLASPSAPPPASVHALHTTPHRTSRRATPATCTSW